jgi:hypothetical protein
MKNIGLVTYHAAYNYGSVLQAYATQYSIEKMGCVCEIINFRSASQKYAYSLYKFPFNIKIDGIRTIIIPFYRFLKYFKNHKQWQMKSQKFEYFIENVLKTTKEYNSVKSIYEEQFKYDIFITGSDQPWNIHCHEMNNEKIDCSGVYFLDFVTDAPRAAFATSIGNMTEDELMEKKKYLNEYNYISTRELIAKNKLEKIVNKNIDLVLDPAFLLSKEEWIQVLNISSNTFINGEYVLLYSLGGNDQIKIWISHIKEFVKNRSWKIVCITPFSLCKIDDVVQISDAGPLDFLNIFNNATYVFADSFHGTVFSIIFRKSFMVLGNKYYKNDIRKSNLLKLFNMESRLIEDENEINSYLNIDLDYEPHDRMINEQIKHSKRCLNKILELINNAEI